METLVKVFLGESPLEKFILVKFPTLKIFKSRVGLLIRRQAELEKEGSFVFRTWANPEQTIKDLITKSCSGDEKADISLYLCWYYIGKSPVKLIPERYLYGVLYDTPPSFKGLFADDSDRRQPAYETILDIDWSKVGNGKLDFVKQLVDILRLQNHESLISDGNKK